MREEKRVMSLQKPIIIDQAELAWEGWEDADLAAKSEIRWKLLVTGERGPSSGLVTGVAEFPPGTRLPLHHHEPVETYYVVSGNGHMVIDDHEAEIGRVQQSISRPTRNMLSAVPALSHWFLCSPSHVTASTK